MRENFDNSENDRDQTGSADAADAILFSAASLEVASARDTNLSISKTVQSSTDSTMSGLFPDEGSLLRQLFAAVPIAAVAGAGAEVQRSASVSADASADSPAIASTAAFQALLQKLKSPAPSLDAEEAPESPVFLLSMKPAEPGSEDDRCNKIDELIKEGKLDEATELLKKETAPSVLLYGVDKLREVDKTGVHVAELARPKTELGMLVLSEVMNSPPKGALKALVAERIKDGSVTEALLNGKLTMSKLLQLRVDGETLFKGLKAPVAKNPEKLVQLCKIVLGAEVKVPPANAEGQAGRIAWQKTVLADMQSAATEVYESKVPKIEQARLLSDALEGKVEAAVQMEKLWKSEPFNFPNYDKTKTIPTEAIQTFHQRISLIGIEHGLTKEEHSSYERTSTERAEFCTDAKAALSNARGNTAVLTAAYGSVKVGNPTKDPDNMRKALAGEKVLLERYEALLASQPEHAKVQAKLDKVVGLVHAEVKQLAKAGGIPDGVKLDAKEIEYEGTYRVQGKVSLCSEHFTKARLQSSESVDTVVHELSHMEQDAMRLKYLMEKAGVKKGEPVTPQQFSEVAAAYEKINPGAKLTQDFFDAVAESWDGKPMDEKTKRRAERLIVNEVLAPEVEKTRVRLQERAADLTYIRKQVESSTGLEQLKALFAKDGLDKTRENLAKYTGAQTSSEPILKSFDALAQAIQRGDDFSTPEFKALRKNFSDACRNASIELIKERAKIYREAYHEVEAFAQGDRASAIVTNFRETTEPSSLSSEKVDLLLARLRPKLIANSPLLLHNLTEECAKFFQNEHRMNRDVLVALNRTSVAYDAELKPGESKLVMLDAKGNQFVPTEFFFDTASGKKTGNFKTAEGNVVPVSDVKFQVRLGKDTDVTKSAAETAIRMNEIIDRLSPESALNTPDAAEREASRYQHLRELFAEATSKAGAKLGAGVAARPALENRVTTAVVDNGTKKPVLIKIGKSSVEIDGVPRSHDQLIESTRDKAMKELAALEKTKENEGKRAALLGQINDLTNLQDRIARGDQKAVDELNAQILKEANEAKQARDTKKPGAATGHGGRKTAYLMVGAFVAGMVFASEDKGPETGGSFFPRLQLD